MRTIAILSILLFFAVTSCGQNDPYPGQFTIKTHQIGDRVDTTLFSKIQDLYLPNHLDGWTMANVSQLPEKYAGLPIAIWQSKQDSSIALTLLDNVVLNISVSFLTDAEKVEMQNMFASKFGRKAKQKSYEETHPLQDWITYWNLLTWETKDVIVQIGNSEMRKPNQSPRKEIRWNMVYSDFLLEEKAIDEFKQKIFSNKEDSLKFSQKLASRKNGLNPRSDGMFTNYFDNGQLKQKGNYKNGKKNGLWESWFENGQKEDSARYNNGILTNKRVLWYANGQIQLESYWAKSDIRVGKWIRYYENGQIESITNFNNQGQLHGKHVQYFENGQLKREVTYHKDEETEDIVFNEKGKRMN